ncbi:MAG: response regulator [Chloroflexaceae bacterium]|nr:response regulator [Chloroflexaceae bacterium]
MTEARILIAEPDPALRANLCEALENQGYLVVGETGDGGSAITMARQIRPDLVMSDVEMPHTNGIEVSRILYREGLAPVVLTTSQATRDLTVRASRAGVLGFLIKPVQESELMPVIEVVRARWQEHRTRTEELDRLREQLETRTVIERAKGHLMDTHGLREAEAFRKIQKLAMNNRRTMKEVAQAILLAQQLQR